MRNLLGIEAFHRGEGLCTSNLSSLGVFHPVNAPLGHKAGFIQTGICLGFKQSPAKPKSPSPCCCPNPVLVPFHKNHQDTAEPSRPPEMDDGREKSQSKSTPNIFVGYPCRIIVTDLNCHFSLPLVLQISSKNYPWFCNDCSSKIS